MALLLEFLWVRYRCTMLIKKSQSKKWNNQIYQHNKYVFPVKHFVTGDEMPL